MLGTLTLLSLDGKFLPDASCFPQSACWRAGDNIDARPTRTDGRKKGAAARVSAHIPPCGNPKRHLTRLMGVAC